MLVHADGGAGSEPEEEVGKGVGQAELGCGAGAPHAGAEHPEVGGAGGVWGDAEGGEGMACGEVVVEPGEELADLVGEVVEHLCVAVALEGEGFDGPAAGSAADAEVDTAGIHGPEGAEDFGDLEGGVMREHDAAGADADAGGLGADAGEEDLGRGAGEEIHGVVLGHPVAGVAEAVDEAGELAGAGDGLGGRAALGDGRLVEDGEPEGAGVLVGHGCLDVMAVRVDS